MFQLILLQLYLEMREDFSHHWLNDCMIENMCSRPSCAYREELLLSPGKEPYQRLPASSGVSVMQPEESCHYQSDLLYLSWAHIIKIQQCYSEYMIIHGEGENSWWIKDGDRGGCQQNKLKWRLDLFHVMSWLWIWSAASCLRVSVKHRKWSLGNNQQEFVWNNMSSEHGLLLSSLHSCELLIVMARKLYQGLTPLSVTYPGKPLNWSVKR